MIKRKIGLIAILLLCILVPFGCKEEDEIKVTASQDVLVLKDSEVENYNFKTLFKIEKNGENVDVIDEYINKSSITSAAGTYVITCTYQGVQKSINVVVNKTIYTVSLTTNEITLTLSEVENYDFQSLFIATMDGQEVSIESSMIESNVTSSLGEYTYKVTLGDASKSLKVIVVENEIIYNLELSKEEITIKDIEAENYDFKSLFKATINGEITSIQSSMIESNVDKAPGAYTYKVTLGNISKTLKVIVTETVYNLELSKEELIINETLAENYDFKSLFTATIDGEEVAIEDDMIETDVLSVPGTYTYKVTLGNISKTLIISVTSDHEIIANVSYKELNVEISSVNTFDYTVLFDLYVDGKVVRVTNEMLDLSKLTNVEVGKSYEVSFSYTLEKTTCNKTAIVNIVAEGELVVNTKNIIAYPNSEFIDLTKLFEIKKGEEVIKVTSDMITGTIDYSLIGVNTITLNYLNNTYESTVEIVRGVIINYSKGETITIMKGTTKDTYSFSNDFIVLVNGIKMNDVLDSYINIENVDFNTVGEYEAIISIPYNYETLPRTGVNFVYYEKTIKYNVIENNYKINVKNDFVTLPKGTTEYNVFENVQVVINNRNQTLTNVKEYVDSITCYAECHTEIDFNNIGEQIITLLIYVDGVNKDPIEVTYKVMMESNIKVSAIDSIVFVGDTLFTKDLFTITDAEDEIDVTYDMITGKVDTFVPGVYYVSINYQEIHQTSKVIVVDRNILGTYHTNLTTIGSSGGSDSEGYEDEGVQTSKLNDLVFTGLDNLVINNNKAVIIGAIDENTLLIKIGSNEFTLYYDNGIIVLDPDNSIKLSYNEIKRPYIYFSEDIWKIENNVTINYSSSHVLQVTTLTYSIDTFKLKSLIDDSEMWYGLKIQLIEKTGSDTVYTVSWGEVIYADDFVQTVDAASSLVYENDKYSFTMTSKKVGKVTKEVAEKQFANMVFSGTVNGQSAKLISNQFEGFDLEIDGTVVASVFSPEYLNMCSIVTNYADCTVLISSWGENIFAYKFILDPITLTFTYVEKDRFYGKYVNDSMYLFANGYGSGIVNFNTKSYYTTKFVYDTANNVMDITFVDIKPTFEYGKTMSLYIDNFNNTVTINDFANAGFIGQRLENSHITDGAIVHFNSYKVGAQSSAPGKTALYDNIEIITKDGVLDNTAKANFIDTSKIRFTTAGFYQLIINIPFNNTTVSEYYAIQILEKKYEGNEIASSYGSGVLFKENSMSLDIYGQAFLTCSGVNYSGTCKINEDDTFTIKASSSNSSITLTGTKIASGIVLVRCSGAVSFTDYFTTGTNKVSGDKTTILREFNVSGNLTYILCSSASTTGVIVDVEKVTDSILKITNNENVSFVKINYWGNTNTGLTVADKYRGTYTLQDNDTIVLDGFGTATVGQTTGTYVLNNDAAIISTSLGTKVYKLDITTYTYEEIEIALDNSLLVGKTYSSSYSFACSGYLYVADTSFAFKENGVVVVKSTSDSHDSGEEMCTEDSYDPPFASKTGVNGRYSVSGNKLTIDVNDIQFIFVIDNVLKLDSITCTATPLTNNDHGMFSANTVFSK